MKGIWLSGERAESEPQFLRGNWFIKLVTIRRGNSPPTKGPFSNMSKLLGLKTFFSLSLSIGSFQGRALSTSQVEMGSFTFSSSALKSSS